MAHERRAGALQTPKWMKARGIMRQRARGGTDSCSSRHRGLVSLGDTPVRITVITHCMVGEPHCQFGELRRRAQGALRAVQLNVRGIRGIMCPQSR